MLKTIVKGCEPQLATKYSAAIDLFASEDVVICAGETRVVGLGVCIYNLDAAISREFGGMLESNEFRSIDRYREWFKESHYLELHPRSSLRAKGLIAGVGVIDLDFKDEIKIIIHNPIKKATQCFKSLDNGETYIPSGNIELGYRYEIKKGDKIAQILLKEHKTYLMGITSNEERKGGFGSTDK